MEPTWVFCRQANYGLAHLKINKIKVPNASPVSPGFTPIVLLFSPRMCFGFFPHATVTVTGSIIPAGLGALRKPVTGFSQTDQAVIK